jgi:hypothetical protein
MWANAAIARRSKADETAATHVEKIEAEIGK